MELQLGQSCTSHSLFLQFMLELRRTITNYLKAVKINNLFQLNDIPFGVYILVNLQLFFSPLESRSLKSIQRISIPEETHSVTQGQIKSHGTIPALKWNQERQSELKQKTIPLRISPLLVRLVWRIAPPPPQCPPPPVDQVVSAGRGVGRKKFQM
ncbi:hypothetical protein CEXT_362851 [Caerostris extrusa]|uniref:Uncharacterized protein n=1 Tax=Caerostris extrusa TaxID=172846 RepID=A0AAV4PDM6_CAEEX|nr:hypothetical protein CEXT_362851 [Caerostris extrusa]